MKKAIIVGASSGIGRELAKILATNGYIVGIVARRHNLLVDLSKEISAKVFIKVIDVSKPDSTIPLMEELISEMNGVDLFILNSGTGFINEELEWHYERDTIDVNVVGFTAVLNVAFQHLRAKNSGHIVAISSIAALRGSGAAPAYNASKAYISNYMQGIRQKCNKLKLPIIVTDVQPGLVDTAMAKGDGLFWVAPPAKAAGQIFTAISQGKSHVYVTKRWRLIAWLFKLLPDWIYHKL